MANSDDPQNSSNDLLRDSEKIEIRLNAYLAEYQALRAEIEWLIRDGTQYQKFAVALLGIVFAAFGWITQNIKILILPTLLAIPFLFSLLGFLFIRQHEEVYIVAAYIKENIRPKVRNLLSDHDLWDWEEFKSNINKNFCKGRLFRCFSSSKMVVILRTLIFVIPSIVCLSSACVYFTMKGLSNLIQMYQWPLLISFVVCFFFDVVVFVFFVLYLFTQTDLPKRSGITNG